jgi:hypothetical protein
MEIGHFPLFLVIVSVEAVFAFGAEAASYLALLVFWVQLFADVAG